MQDGDDRDPFAEAEEQEVLREREARRRNVAMLRQMAPSQVHSTLPRLAMPHQLRGNVRAMTPCRHRCACEGAEDCLFRSSECLSH